MELSSARFLLGTIVLVTALATASAEDSTLRFPSLPDPVPYRGEAVLFAFDDAAFPARLAVRKQLIHGRHKAFCISRAAGTHENRVYYWGTTIRVSDKDFRMWYMGISDRSEPQNGRGYYVCYATSRDGVKWTKPKLGLVKYDGTKDNNICDYPFPPEEINELITVLYDPDDPDPKRRFKSVFKTNRQDPGWGTAFSADGLQWKRSPFSPPYGNHPVGGTKFRGKYYVPGHGLRIPGGPPYRALMIHSSSDFVDWKVEGNGLPDRVPAPGSHVNSGEQVHCGIGMWNRGNVIVGVYSQWHGLPDHQANRKEPGSSFIGDLGLALSHDGKNFVEPIPNAPLVKQAEQPTPKEGPSKILQHGQGMYSVGDRTYYWHGWFGSGSQMVEWDRDRLGYLEAAGTASHITSMPIEVGTGSVNVYVNASNLGGGNALTLSVVDQKGQDLPGYSGRPLRTNGFREKIKWGGGAVLRPDLRTFRIKVAFAGASRLHAIYIGDGEGAYVDR